MADDRGCSLEAVGLAFVTGGLVGAAWCVATVSGIKGFGVCPRAPAGDHTGAFHNQRPS
jgi:hypothetical protein